MPRHLGLGTLRLLAALREGATYGLDIVARTGMPSGTVYPCMGRLLTRGLVRAHWEDEASAQAEGRPRRKYYELTAEGERVLNEEAQRVRMLAAELGTDPSRSA